MEIYMNASASAAPRPAEGGLEGSHPGATLRRAREAAGWSQRELATRAGVHQPQVARAESGQDIQLSLLARLAAPYELTPTALKRLLWISLPGLKKRLDRLVERGLITRSENPRDARGLVVRLTVAGMEMVDEMVRHSPEPLWHTLTETAPADLARLSAQLLSFLARLEARLGDS